MHARRASVPGVPLTARETLQSALLAWFAENGRDLPWRRTRDPYAILVSEVMLQQTQVARVLERYPPWLERWPTAAALAAAPAADVLRAWSGLGYNRRALNLQNAARRVVELGEFPRDDRRARAAARHRPVHGARDRVLRVRRPGHRARHERAARARALARNHRRGAAAGPRLGLEPGALRPRRAGLPGSGAALRGLPAGCLVPLARADVRAAAPSEPLRGLAPAASRGARAGARRVARAQTAATIGTWSTPWSPTASPCAEQTACWPFPRRSPPREHSPLCRQRRSLPRGEAG